MSQHTPGPWEIDQAIRHGFTVYSQQAGFIVGYMDEEGRYGAVESEANARLIAAAPDLLEALEELLVQREGHYSTQTAWDKARAAIAKARGEK
jgi:hypothetical protein